MKKNIYTELNEHLDEVLFGDWYGVSRTSRIGIETHEQKRIPGTDVIPLEILPADNDRYVKDGIQQEDIIIMWIDDNAFIPISFKKYNDIYDKVFDDNEGENIVNNMYDALESHIKMCMERCGFGDHVS